MKLGGVKMKYIIETDTEENLQKKLNQWRHDYKINILQAFPLETSGLTASNTLTVILTREEK